MILSVEGPEKTAKSTLAYSGPLPLIVFSYDMSHDRALYGTKGKELFRGVEIVKHRFEMGKPAPEPHPMGVTVYIMPQPVRIGPVQGFIEQWVWMLNRFVVECQKVGGTIVFDTMTLCNRNKRDAYIEEMNNDGKKRTSLLQIEYGRPNGDIRQLYTFAKSCEKNMVVVHHLKEHYAPTMINGQLGTAWDGTWDVDGIGDTDKYVDIVLRQSVKDGKVYSEYRVCGINLSMVGQKFPDMTWNKVVQQLEDRGWEGPEIDRRVEVGT